MSDMKIVEAENGWIVTRLYTKVIKSIQSPGQQQLFIASNMDQLMSVVKDVAAMDDVETQQ